MQRHPTEARERQKDQWKKKKELAEAEGEKAKEIRKKRPVADQHFDDCGEDLSFIELGKEVLWTDDRVADLPSFLLDRALTDQEEQDIADISDPSGWLSGRATDHPHAQGAAIFLSLAAILKECDRAENSKAFVDIMEIMGGEARATQCLVRQRFRQGFRPGRNISLVCNFDLMDPWAVADMWRHIRRTKPLVIVMSPPCTGMKGWGALNAMINPHNFQKNRAISENLGSLCGEVATHQLRQSRHHLRAHSAGTDLNKVRPWPESLSNPCVVSCVMHQ